MAPPRQLERLPAPFARHLPSRALSGHVRFRKDQLQPDQPEHRPPHQVRPRRCRDRRGGGQRRHRASRSTPTPTSRSPREELENVALKPTRTIEIDEFVQRDEIDPRYIIRPYYLRPEVAIGRVVLTSREHIIALEPLDKGLMGTLLRYPYEVRAEGEYFDEIQDVNHHARPGQTHRQPEVRTVRAGII
jgi:hypothetical protein